ncbi:MAG: hypothetical protein ACM3SQ_18665 [Betaproteobacteria bacterium]
MIARRKMLGVTLVGGLLGGTAEPAEPAAPSDVSDQTVRQIVDALKDLRRTLEAPRQFTELSAIRTRQIDFLRAQAKFPDFIDVATDVWFGVYDWHINHLQPPAIGRDATGRYTIRVLETTVVLHPEAVPGYVGPPYDSR